MMVAALTAGCGPRDDGPEIGGPLEPLTAEGGVSVDVPNGAPNVWSGSFSGLSLCLEEGGDAATLEEVKVLDTAGTVDDVRTFVLTPSGDATEWDGSSFISAVGSAPDFGEPYAGSDAEFGRLFDYQPDLSAAEIKAECGSAFDGAEHKLVFTFSTDSSGGAVRSWEVVYQADGKRYTTGPIAWEMMLCGDSRVVRAHCQGASA